MSPRQSIFNCKHCGTPLGVTVGASLRMRVVDERTGDIITVEFDQKPVSPRCGKCGDKTFWTPNKKAA